MTACYCGTSVPFESCCEPLLSGGEAASTAEALMRARYSAYVITDADFLFESLDPEERHDFDQDSVLEWSKNADWQGLEIVSTKKGTSEDVTGEVEFIAKYVIDDEYQEHRERSRFRRVDGRWYFVDGEVQTVGPIVREHPKIGRNDPCPCGSGKKHKKCCA